MAPSPCRTQLPLSLLGRPPDIVAAALARRGGAGRHRRRASAVLSEHQPDGIRRPVEPRRWTGCWNPAAAWSASARRSGCRYSKAARLRAKLQGRVADYDAAVDSYNQTLTDALREVADQVQSLRVGASQSARSAAASRGRANALRLAQPTPARRHRQHAATCWPPRRACWRSANWR